MNRFLLLAGLGAAGYFAYRALAPRYDFRGKHVVITGGSRGLGLLMARRFGAEGARLVICSRDDEELRRAEADLRGHGARVTAVHCDVRLKVAVEDLIRSAVATHGGIDVLVNNAGVIQVGPIESMTEQDFGESLDTHFWAPLHAINAVLPVMRGRGGGRIVNISSIGGKVAVPHLAPYCAGKFALAGLSQALTTELRRDNIFVTTVYPHLIRTGSPRNALFKGRNVREYAWFTLGDSLPGVSQDADRAADRIVNACRYGEPELVTALPAALAARFHALMPWLSLETAAAVNQVALPSPGGIGTNRARGHQSESAITQSPLTKLTRDAAERNNEVLPTQ
jgi:NAD(P)-dependent dehydrogenase (short-subunit alcohol dehydrogenase family)